MLNLEANGDLEQVLRHAGDVWERFRGKTLFLTGGTGFFGKWLTAGFCYANRKLDLNARMIVLSRDPERYLAQYPELRCPGISFVAGDIRHFDFPEGGIDFIIHAATEASVKLNNEQPLLMYDTIVEGTRRVLELAKQKQVTAILHTSSGAVYGVQPSEITHVPETYGGSPDIYSAAPSYGEGKRVAEMLSCIYRKNYGVPSKIARCFAFVGPYLPLDTHFAVGNFIRDVMAGNEIKINGDGSPYRSYLYAADLAVWLWRILVHGESCRPYNVGSDEDVSISELAGVVASVGSTPVSIDVAVPYDGHPPARYVPDVKRAKDELNLRVNTSLREGILKTINFYSNLAG